MRALTLLEGRALGVLVEKAHTVPDSYPLSLNALTLGANQKTAREPVLNVSEAEVRDAIDGLKTLHLVLEASASRVTRYEHNMARALALPSQSVALLATLLLRGPQTTSELRANAERLHRFSDLSSVEGFLDELATRSDDRGGALATKMARAPGAREARWTHLLCGAAPESSPPETDAPAAAGAGAGAGAAAPALQAGRDALAARVDALTLRVEQLARELAAMRAAGPSAPD